MSDTTADAATAADETTSPKDVRAIVSRVTSLSIFFVGVGLFASIGLAMYQLAVFSEYQLTYFAVGGAVGIVGVLLWLVAR